MLVSKYLIGKFLPKIHEIDDQNMISACGAIGIEVEAIHHHPITNNLVVGEILKVTQHPNADKLHICEVKVDKNGDVHTIICGAANVAVHKKVVVALTGATLYDGRTIESKEIRGIVSNGMICSYSELTPLNNFLSASDSEGIIILDDAIVGDKDVNKYLGLNDTIYDLSLPTNRNDLNGVLPLCQELSGYFKWNYFLPLIEEFKGNFKFDLKLQYDDQIADGICIIKIKNISQQASNWLFKSLLMNNGIRPINSILDQLAYITLLTNVPTAVYDADKITNNLSIQLAKDKEEILGFDKQRYKLTDTDIVVKSDENTIGLAGIIGASEYGMSNETKDILIEAANFNFINIRKTAFRLNIQTDAAKRFSRKISIYLNRLALKLICEQFANYQISYPVVAFKEQVPLTIPMDYDFINRFIGINLTKQAIQDNLQYYGFRFKDDQCIPPLNRLDVVSIQDISEEVLKFIDINELPTTPITGEINTTQTNCHYRLLCKLKALLNSNYINEVKTYNLTSELDLNEMNVFKYANNIKIENAHHPSRAYLRTNLIDQLLKVYQFNDSYKTTLVPIFELQKIYYDSKHSLNLTIIASGKIYIDRIVGSQILVNVNWLKALSNSVSKLFNAKFEYFITNESKIFYNNELLAIQCNGQLIGYIGLIKSSKLKKYDLQAESIYCLTINLESLLTTYVQPTLQFEHVSKLMPIYKDVSFMIHHLEKINNLLTSLNTLDFIHSYEFIDRYQINAEQISYTIRFNFNNAKGTDNRTIDNYLKEVERRIIENHATIRK